MKKLCKLLGLALSAILALGIFMKGAYMKALAVETSAYLLNCPADSNNNSYTTRYDATVNGVTWNAPGNQFADGAWRLGGKGTSAVDRIIYSKTAISDNISSVEVKVTPGATFNGVKMDVYSTAELAAAGSTGDVATFESSAGTNNTILFSKADSKSWENCYYSFCFNLTLTSKSSNKFITLNSIEFFKIVELQKHTITYKANGPSLEDYTQKVEHEITTNLTNNLFVYEGYSFDCWTTNSDGSGTKYNNSQSVTLSSDLILYAQWKTPKNLLTSRFNAIRPTTSLAMNYSYHSATSVEEKFTYQTTPLFTQDGSGYTAWSTTQNSNGVTYAGTIQKIAGDTKYIQMSNSVSSGITVSSTSKYITKVDVTWSTTQATSSGRSLKICGSDKPYTSYDDLKDDQTKGTLLGTISIDNKNVSTSLEIDGLYCYIGIIAVGGAVYLDAIDFTYSNFVMDNINNLSLLYKMDFDFASYTYSSYTTGVIVTKDASFVNTNAAPTGKIINFTNSLKKSSYVVAVNNVSLDLDDYNTIYHAVGYLLIEGQYHYSSLCSYSLENMVDEYKNTKYGLLVNDLANAIENQVAA